MQLVPIFIINLKSRGILVLVDTLIVAFLDKYLFHFQSFELVKINKFWKILGFFFENFLFQKYENNYSII